MSIRIILGAGLLAIVAERVRMASGFKNLEVVERVTVAIVAGWQESTETNDPVDPVGDESIATNDPVDPIGDESIATNDPVDSVADEGIIGGDRVGVTGGDPASRCRRNGDFRGDDETDARRGNRRGISGSMMDKTSHERVASGDSRPGQAEGRAG